MSKRILYIHYLDEENYPPLLHSIKILKQNNWQVLISQRGKHRKFFPEYLNFIFHFFATLFKYLFFLPDLLYVSDSKATLIALLINKFSRAKIIYHEHDFPIKEKKFFLYLRKKIAQYSIFCILPSHSRKKLFCQQTTTSKTKIIIVLNCPSISDIPVTPAKEDDHFTIHYHGTIVPDRLPKNLIRAIRLLPFYKKVTFSINGQETFSGKGHIKELLALSEKLGMPGLIKYNGFTNRQDLFRSYNLGISLMPTRSSDPNHRTMAGASNKAFEYLACQTPLLVTDLPDWKEMFTETGYAKDCNPDNIESINQAILFFFNNKDRARDMGKIGQKKILNEWNYEKQFEKVMKEINGYE